MRNFFTVLMMFVLVDPIAAQEIKFIPIGPYPRNNVYGDATLSPQGLPPVEITSPDGRPVIYGRKFKSMLLNWPGADYGYYAARRVADYPASTNSAIQLAQQQANPTSLWQALVYGFSGAAYVRALSTDAFDQNQDYGYSFRSGEPVTVGLPVPNTNSADVWFADVTMQITYTRDAAELDSFLTRLASFGLYGWKNISALQKFSITVHFQNAATGNIIPFERSTVELVPLYEQKERYFFRVAVSKTERWSTKDPITAVMQSIAQDFIQQFPAKIGLSESEIAGRQVDREVVDKQAELERLRATNQRLRELKPICEQIRAEGGELDEICRKALALP